MSHILKQNSTKKQVSMRLDDEDEDSGDSLQLVPGTSGNNVPSTCTWVQKHHTVLKGCLEAPHTAN